MATAAELVVAFRADVAQFRRELDGVKREVKQTESTIQGMAASVKNAFAVFGGAAAIVGGVQAVMRAVLEQEKAAAKLDATLRATGGAVGLTRDELMGLADQVAKQSLFDDDAIVDGIAVLTTFRNIQGETFKEATQLAADMATVMNTDLQSALVQVGKALNDPIKGITALQRVGVSFNAEQKQMIEGFAKVNDLASAQRVILQELAAEFGGAGAESTKGLAGSIHAVTMAWDNMLASLAAGESTFAKVVNGELRGLAKLMELVSGGAQVPVQTQRVMQVQELTQRRDNLLGLIANPGTTGALTLQRGREAQELQAQIEAISKLYDAEQKRLAGVQAAAKQSAASHKAELDRAAAVDAALARENERRSEALRLAKEQAAVAKAQADYEGEFWTRERQKQIDLMNGLSGMRREDARVVGRRIEIPGGLVSPDDAVGRSLAQGESERNRALAALAQEQERMERAQQQAKQYEAIWAAAARGVTDVLVDGFIDVLTLQEDGLRKFGQSMLDLINDISKQLLKQAIYMGIASLFGIPTGGGFGGGFGGGGGLGGLFGLSAEGDADAWAGAPGETAPLGEPLSARAGMTMQTNITFNVSALDGASVRNVIAEQAPQIAEIVGNAAQRSAAYRRRLNGL